MEYSNLIDILKNRSGGDRLQYDLEKIKERAIPFLDQIPVTFPEFTNHGIKHSEEILRIYNFIIPDSLKNLLNKYEIFFLIASAYLHDIGMVDFPSLIDPDTTDEEKRKLDIREKHHLRSEIIINKIFFDLGIESAHQAKIIGRICRGHRKEDLSVRSLFNYEQLFEYDQINIPLLSVILRIADGLDLTASRTPIGVYEQLTPRDEISQREWKKHLSIIGCVPLRDSPLTIGCSATCFSPDIHRELKILESKINADLYSYHQYLHHYREVYKDIPTKFVMNIESEGYIAYNYKFTLNESAIIKLLMGDRLYKDKTECIRELIKNAYDSCRIQHQRHPHYLPEISIGLESDGTQLFISDNGTGMDEYIIETYLTKVGHSFFNSQDFTDQDYDFSPVSELGIGFLSCFMIADKIIIDTKAQDHIPLLIEIDNVGDYFWVKESQKKDTGTKISLQLKPDFSNLPIQQIVKRFARHLDYPIIIREENSKGVIGDSSYFPKLDDYRKQLEGKYKTKFQFFTVPIESSLGKGMIGLLFEWDNSKRAYYPVKTFGRRRRNFNNETEDESFIASIEGIFISNESLLPRWLFQPKNSGWYINGIFYSNINLNGSVVDLNIARNQIVRNEKFDFVINEFGRQILSQLDNYLSELEIEFNGNKEELLDYIYNFFENYINRIRAEDGSYCEEISELYKKHCHFRVLTSKGSDILKWEEIIRKGKEIEILYGFPDNLHHLFFYYPKIWLNQIQTMVKKFSAYSEDKEYVLFPYRILGYSFNPYDIGKIFEAENVKSKSFFANFTMQKKPIVPGIFPSSWKIYTFVDYKSTRFFEFTKGNSTILNADNPFLHLIIEHQNGLSESDKMILYGFFKGLRTALSNNFPQVLLKQNKILKDIFVDSMYIQESDIQKYLIKEKDFSPHYVQIK